MAGGKNYGKNKVVFRVPPNLGKIQIKDYLTKLYNLNVKSVHTINVEGKKKRVLVRQGRKWYKLPDYKKAIVELDEAQFAGPIMATPSEETSASTASKVKETK
jgi:large subunit ribosomal protein L23